MLRFKLKLINSLEKVLIFQKRQNFSKVKKLLKVTNSCTAMKMKDKLSGEFGFLLMKKELKKLNQYKHSISMFLKTN
jgi:hypothetical protein